MKNVSLLLFTFLLSSLLLSTHAQDITGQWNGALNVPGASLRLVLHIEASDGGYISTMDSPDQGATGIPVSETSFADSILVFKVAALGVSFKGTLDTNGVIQGTFIQNGYTFPLELSREVIEKEIQRRPQEPKPPFPYYTEEVQFPADEGRITLAATLTLPDEDGPHPVVILISGSGPQDRNEEILGHKPFLVIADHLTSAGIGVLRYDDRGTAASTGDFKAATSKDFAADVESAVTYLQTRSDIDLKNIGLMGHSEGGLIAPMVAAQSDEVAFIVLLAGPGVSGYEILIQQTDLILGADGSSESQIESEIALLTGIMDIILAQEPSKERKEELEELEEFMKATLEHNKDLIPDGMKAEDYIAATLQELTTPWFEYFIKYDPATSLLKVQCPVLAINGSKDLQVPSKSNLDAIEKHLTEGGNEDITTVDIPNLNHLFQTCETGSPNEYAQIEETFSPLALEEITRWILAQIK